MTDFRTSPVSARDAFAQHLLRQGYDPMLGFTKDALEAFDVAHKSGLWRPIETAPHETKILLGWYEYGTCGDWICETGQASHGWTRNGVSTMSLHSRATHWMPLPQGPNTSTL